MKTTSKVVHLIMEDHDEHDGRVWVACMTVPVWLDPDVDEITGHVAYVTCPECKKALKPRRCK